MIQGAALVHQALNPESPGPVGRRQPQGAHGASRGRHRSPRSSGRLTDDELAQIGGQSLMISSICRRQREAASTRASRSGRGRSLGRASSRSNVETLFRATQQRLPSVASTSSPLTGAAALHADQLTQSIEQRPSGPAAQESADQDCVG